MILVGLGGNLDSVYGSVYETADKAYAFLDEEGVRVKDSSPWFRTAPVPVSDQPWYRNRVFSVETDKSAKKLLETLLKVEDRLGRTRSVRNAARVLDLDLLAYDREVIDEEPELIVPHPRMHLRAFVLYPLREIAPSWEHPVLKKDVSTLIRELPEVQEVELDRLAGR